MPGRLVCFVCGSQGADSCLRIRQHDREPYFPFLVHHDPPKGARLPSAEGIIDSCRLCFMFLTQQWDSYERSKTPLVKRLYWLKRTDNGTFTGAEMRVQGEYIAQVMGLQYPPGYEDGSPPVNSANTSNPERDYGNQAQIPSNSSYSYGTTDRSVKENISKSSTSRDSILDLSTPKKEDKMYSSNERHAHRSSKDHGHFICYICGQNEPFSNRNYLSVIQIGKGEPFFPILERISPAQGSEGIKKPGCVKTCTTCKNVLLQQWQAYEMTGTAVHQRNYRLPSTTDYIRDHETSIQIKKEDMTAEKIKHMCCYICGNTYIVEHVRLLNTLPLNQKKTTPTPMYFPFVRELKRPANAQPLRSDGSVIVCIKCYGHLSHQWDIQKVKGVPLHQRHYSLDFLPDNEESGGIVLKEEEPSYRSPPPKSDQIQPLNIQISDTSPGQSAADRNQEFTSAQGLLAIAHSGDVDSNSSISNSPVKCPDNLTDTRLDFGTNTKTVPHPLQKVCDIPKKICFLCGERCIIHKMKSLFSYPSRHEAKHSNQTEPFFPFLETVTPPQGAEPINEEGSVIVCKLCFYSLLKQWSDFEQSPNPADSNRWLRKYAMTNYVCYVCSIEGERKFMRTIAVEKFYFLKHHKAAKSALIIDDGQRVVVCKACAYSLMQQFAEFERMGLPPKLRKFNWMQRAGHVWKDEGEEESQEHNKQETTTDNEDEDSRPVLDDFESEWSKSPRALAIERVMKTNKIHGYLDIKAQNGDRTAAKTKPASVVTAKPDIAVKTKPAPSVQSKPAARGQRTTVTTLTTKPLGRKTTKQNNSKMTGNENPKTTENKQEQQRDESSQEQNVAENQPTIMKGSDGRFVRVLFQGAGEASSSSCIALPQRPPRFEDDLSQDQRDVLTTRIAEHDVDKRSIGTQTEPVIIFESREELLSSYDPKGRTLSDISTALDKLNNMVNELREPVMLIPNVLETLNTVKEDVGISKILQEGLSHSFSTPGKFDVVEVVETNESEAEAVPVEMLEIPFIHEPVEPTETVVSVGSTQAETRTEPEPEVNENFRAERVPDDHFQYVLQPTTTSYMYGDCTPGPIAEISSASDMASIPEKCEVRVSSILLNQVSIHTSWPGSYGWQIVQRIFMPHELMGRNYYGSHGKQPISPRRRHALEHIFADKFGLNQDLMRQAVSGINTGIRNSMRIRQPRRPLFPLQMN